MKKKPYVGIRAKALLAVVMLVLVPSLFLAALTYSLKDETVRTVKGNTVEERDKQIHGDMIKLNRNATWCIEKYMQIIEAEGKSAGNDLKYHLGMNYTLSDTLWYSKNLTKQINYTQLSGIMDGSINNTYYWIMVNAAGKNGKNTVDSSLNLFFQTLELNYSSAFVNKTLHTALKELNTILIGAGKKTVLFDFFRSILLPEPKKELDYILPLGNMLHSFRDSLPDLLWTYYADADSGFTVLISSGKNVTLPPLFNPFVRSWYLDAVKAGGPTWSETYADSISGMLMTTYAVPVYESGRFIGVLGFDILLSTLTKKTKEFYSSNNSFAFIVSENGTALTYPYKYMLGKSLISGDTEFNRSVRAILNETEGEVETNISGKRAFLAHSTINSTGWKFVNVIYCEDILENAEKSAEAIGSIVDKEIMYLMGLVIAVGLIAFVVTFFLVDSFIRDIERITTVANKVSRGNLDMEVEVDAKSEMGDLQRAMKRMLNSLKVAMEELEKGEK